MPKYILVYISNYFPVTLALKANVPMYFESRFYSVVSLGVSTFTAKYTMSWVDKQLILPVVLELADYFHCSNKRS